MKALFCFFLFVACICRGYTVSGNIYTTNGSSSDVQSAANAVPDGGTIIIPSGMFSWGTASVNVNTGCTVQGAGIRNTIITNSNPNNPSGTNSIAINPTNGSMSRVTGISFQGQNCLSVAGATTTTIWRVDNCDFNAGTAQAVLFSTGNNSPGLIDHCTFEGGPGSEMIHNLGMGPEDASGWSDDINPGTENMLYIENCTFTTEGTAAFASAIQSYYGARTCMRYCTLNFCQIDQHGNQGLVGARWFEFYNNSFYIPPNYNQSNFFALRGGSGVVFNNTASGGPNEGAGVIQMYDENGGATPACLGRGINQTYSPVYLWNNTQNIAGNSQSNMPVDSTSSNVTINAGSGSTAFSSATEPSSMIIEETAAQQAQGGTTYEYQPYVYPHPLGTTGTGGPPAPPTNLRIIGS